MVLILLMLALSSQLSTQGCFSALSALSRDLYTGSAAIIAELIQNADDAAFATGTTPELLVSLLDGADGRPGLLVQSNEIGFSAADVRAICDLGASTKRGRPELEGCC